MNYAPKPYYTFNRKRQVINAVLNNLHNTQLDMIDQAVEYSDLQEAKDVIDWIKERL